MKAVQAAQQQQLLIITTRWLQRTDWVTTDAAGLRHLTTKMLTAETVQALALLCCVQTSLRVLQLQGTQHQNKQVVTIL